MPTPRCALFILAVATLPMLAFGQQPTTDVTVVGFTYELDKAGKYTVVSGISVQAFRSGPLLKNPVVSDASGKFELAVAAGEPFDVCFYGADRVPELSQVAGVPKVKNTVHVAMLTVAQYKKSERARRVKLEAKLGCTLNALPEGSEAWKATRELLDKE